MWKIKSVLCLYLYPVNSSDAICAWCMIMATACVWSSIGHVFIMFAENKENTQALADGHNKVIKQFWFHVINRLWIRGSWIQFPHQRNSIAKTRSKIGQLRSKICLRQCTNSFPSIAYRFSGTESPLFHCLLSFAPTGGKGSSGTGVGIGWGLGPGNTLLLTVINSLWGYMASNWI